MHYMYACMTLCKGLLHVMSILCHLYLISVAEAVNNVNSVLKEDDPVALLKFLTSEQIGVENVQEAQALLYLRVLKAMKAAKAEVCVHVLYT